MAVRVTRAIVLMGIVLWDMSAALEMATGNHRDSTKSRWQTGK